MCSISGLNSGTIRVVFEKKNAAQSCYSRHGVQRALINYFKNNEYHRISFKGSPQFIPVWNDDGRWCGLDAISEQEDVR